jgi:hypothetical protein
MCKSSADFSGWFTLKREARRTFIPSCLQNLCFCKFRFGGAPTGQPPLLGWHDVPFLRSSNGMHATTILCTVLQRVLWTRPEGAGQPAARTRAVAGTPVRSHSARYRTNARKGHALPSRRHKSSRWRQSSRRTSICPSPNVCSSPRASNLRKHRYVDVWCMALYAVQVLMSRDTQDSQDNVSHFLFHTVISQRPQNLTKLHNSLATDTAIYIPLKTSLVRWLCSSLLTYFPQECRRRWSVC